MLQILNGNSSLEIDPQGGKITSLILKDKKVLGEFLRADGKVGATHLCSPNFGPDFTGVYHLPQHGPVRSSLWHVESQENQSITISCNIEGNNYPKGMKVTQTFLLQENLMHINILHQNNSDQKLPLYIGMHFYWNTPSGWSAISCNDQNIADSIQRNGTIELKESNPLIIPQVANLYLTQNNFPVAMCWTASKDTIFDQSYACIEPIESNNPKFFGTDESFLEAGQSKINNLTIAINEF